MTSPGKQPLNPPPLPKKPARFLPEVQSRHQDEADSDYLEPLEWRQQRAGNVQEKRKVFEQRQQEVVTQHYKGRTSDKGNKSGTPSHSSILRYNKIGVVNINVDNESTDKFRSESKKDTKKQSYVNVERPFKTTKNGEDFVKAVNLATADKTESDVRSNFIHILHPVTKSFSVDCVLIKLNYRCDSLLMKASERQRTMFNAVTSDNLHESIGGQVEHHVMLLGGPGIGKSLAALRYGKRVLDHKVPELTDVELVHYVQCSKLRSGRIEKFFDLFFKNQLGNYIINKEIAEAGELWIRENPDKVLIILDALDCVVQDQEQSEEMIGPDTPASPFTIICNLFREDIFKGMWIVSTSRWEWMWKLQRSHLPARAIEVKGFSPDRAEELIRFFLKDDSKQRLAKSVFAHFPGIMELCRTPEFLLIVAKILHEFKPSRTEDISQQAILVKVLIHLKTAARSPSYSYLKNVMALAYRSAKEETIEFNHDKARELHGIELRKVEQFLDVKPDPEKFDLAYENIIDYQLSYRFRCSSLRDILAALHIIAHDYTKFKELYKELCGASRNIISILVNGVVMHDRLLKLAKTFTEKCGDVLRKRNWLTRDLESRLSSNFNDVKTMHLLREFKAVAVNMPKYVPGEIKVEEINETSDTYALLSVGRSYPQIKKVKARILKMDSTTLELLSDGVEAQRLIVCGEIFDNDLETLSKELNRNKGIKSVTLEQYSIEYDNEEKNSKD